MSLVQQTDREGETAAIDEQFTQQMEYQLSRPLIGFSD